MSARKILILTGACILFLIQISVLAQHESLVTPSILKVRSFGHWELLGMRVVDYTIDHDMILLDSTMQPLKAVKIRVKEGTVNIHKSTVHFANGEVEDINMPEVLTQAIDGKIIELNDHKRLIEKIIFWYDAEEKANQKSVVEVWGLSR